MDTKIAQKRVDDMAAAMVAKGMREPYAQLNIRADASPQFWLRWKSGIDHNSLLDDDKYKFFDGDIVAVFDNAAAFIAKQPDADQAKLQDFMSALGRVIDIGRKHGIEADYLNPLVASMKQLSERVITHQSAA